MTEIATKERTALLRAMIRQILVDGKVDATDVDEMIKELVNELDASQYVIALEEALRSYVPDVLRKMRQDGPLVPATGRSRKRAAIAEMHAALLAEIYPTASGHKHLGDMERDDVLFNAGMLREQAQKTMERSKGFHRLAKALADHSVTFVRELPPGVFEGWGD